jgi:hypothetical protein
MSRVTDAPPRLVNGDRVRDHRGNDGYARTCKNGKTGESFVGVFITAGPGKGTWGRPHEFNPLLDHEGGSIRTECRTCERVFLATVRVERVGELENRNCPRESKCRTCTGFSRTPAQKERDRELHAVGDGMAKTKHHALAAPARPGIDQSKEPF